MIFTERFKVFEEADFSMEDENNTKPETKKLFFAKKSNTLNTWNFQILYSLLMQSMQ